ncbi:hypothetical protein FG476_09290 [Xylella fastidiosa subsp. multiplex]|uniref:Uncharacterized protein n=1 Tax=Xylella fastidiosa subsp. multiplex TaxID=644357 RepID=A0A9Q4MJ05_XYLFS|nr:conserved hypothetical protein [Xylella fastidiosa M12]MRT34748.1 hypothetical protein [Xylella fastidiosa subsp. multiplex]TNV90182.1 hypothetical protein C5H23_04660 [Xylella fastidiosa]MRT46406.1 hypothetical protein [Xylella fastidiosa subsp. multiplex]MRT53596.1 hypothetical protein [Xylella fastidiosa subsp. multiplex]
MDAPQNALTCVHHIHTPASPQYAVQQHIACKLDKHQMGATSTNVTGPCGSTLKPGSRLRTSSIST